MKPCAMSLLMCSALALVAVGQPPADPKQPPKEDTFKFKPDGKKAAPSALEEMLAKALKQNPDILVAEAKLREAEAELNRVRQKVLARIVVLDAELTGSKAILKEAERRVEQLKELAERDPKIVSTEEYGNAKQVVLKYKAEVASKEAELQVLIGKKFMSGGTSGQPGMS